MITRFAPSPTGPLHLGHAYSAMIAHDMARAAGGQFLLRIDDLDQSRARPEWEDLIYEDLQWLGLSWDGPVRKQSDHFQDYAQALETLKSFGVTYACRCSRREVELAASAPQEGVPAFGPDGRIYPGTCRGLNLFETAQTVTRLDMAAACARGLPAAFTETGPAHAGQHAVTLADMTTTVGDVILSRRQMAAAYHLAVVIDDRDSGVTHVTRGEDLFSATRIHVLLQALLGIAPPVFHHHALIRDDTGKRLAKRDDARAIRTYREEGLTPAQLRALVGL